MEASSCFKRWLVCIGVAGAGAVAGCAQPGPTVVSEPKEVSIAVATKCIDGKDVPPIPAFPLDAVNLNDPTEELARLVNAASLEVKVRREYVRTINDVLQKCVK